jgi:hypothetical protein
MSAVVCGKRSLFEDIHGSPPIAKRIRCGGNSPIRFPSISPVRIGAAGGSDAGSQGRPTGIFLDDHLTDLRALFSDMDGQVRVHFVTISFSIPSFTTLALFRRLLFGA